MPQASTLSREKLWVKKKANTSKIINCHPREGGDPDAEPLSLDPRLRGDDKLCLFNNYVALLLEVLSDAWELILRNNAKNVLDSSARRRGSRRTATFLDSRLLGNDNRIGSANLLDFLAHNF